MVALSKFRLFWDIHRIKVTICDALANLMTKYAKRKYQTQGIRTIKKLSPSTKSGTANKFSFPKTQEVMSNNEIT